MQPYVLAAKNNMIWNVDMVTGARAGYVNARLISILLIHAIRNPPKGVAIVHVLKSHSERHKPKRLATHNP